MSRSDDSTGSLSHSKTDRSPAPSIQIRAATENSSWTVGSQALAMHLMIASANNGHLEPVAAALDSPVVTLPCSRHLEAIMRTLFHLPLRAFPKNENSPFDCSQTLTATDAVPLSSNPARSDGGSQVDPLTNTTPIRCLSVPVRSAGRPGPLGTDPHPARLICHHGRHVVPMCDDRQLGMCRVEPQNADRCRIDRKMLCFDDG
jgi:hypothetical protein